MTGEGIASGDHRHGTTAGYARGCRRDCCRLAVNERKRELYLQQQLSLHPIPLELMGLPFRFARKVQVDSTGCWLWTAALSNGGYARYKTEGTTRYAHTISYRLLVGEYDAELDLDHLCRVRHCVNPAHLEPVTRAENLRRSMPYRTPRRAAA